MQRCTTFQQHEAPTNQQTRIKRKALHDLSIEACHPRRSTERLPIAKQSIQLAKKQPTSHFSQ